jgi:hypothetical protein
MAPNYMIKKRLRDYCNRVIQAGAKLTPALVTEGILRALDDDMKNAIKKAFKATGIFPPSLEALKRLSNEAPIERIQRDPRVVAVTAAVGDHIDRLTEARRDAATINRTARAGQVRKRYFKYGNCMLLSSPVQLARLGLDKMYGKALKMKAQVLRDYMLRIGIQSRLMQRETGKWRPMKDLKELLHKHLQDQEQALVEQYKGQLDPSPLPPVPAAEVLLGWEETPHPPTGASPVPAVDALVAQQACMEAVELAQSDTGALTPEMLSFLEEFETGAAPGALFEALARPTNVSDDAGDAEGDLTPQELEEWSAQLLFG